ncbi:MAG: hypothetical protein JWR51_4504 [Devosia sp.]|uniref:putative bifunctional diguanylate cyclase/phosphodiesterase n=1 Tax=Devosia sp. TaxID=1871048 RepID=UPI0026325E95|nr:bifunctional diguanylate cyclase/phosphodiesterase [Devosia sp.]MDB5531401.1 hypothetical protein [Devosia sp.]
MPRFFFHLRGDHGELADTDGMELSDPMAAQVLARTRALPLLRRLNPILQITDDTGQSHGAVPLGCAAVGDQPVPTMAERSVWLRHWRSWFGNIEELIGAGYFEYEASSNSFGVSRGFARILGLPEDQSLSFDDVLHRCAEGTRHILREKMASAIELGDLFDLDLDLEISVPGEPQRCIHLVGLRDDSRVDGVWVSGVCADISERRRLESEVWDASNHDPLTGLPNRIQFRSRLQAALRQADGAGSRVGILLIGLDHLQDITNQFAERRAEGALRSVGDWLKGLSCGAERVARVGDDAFAIIIPELPHRSRAAVMADTISAGLRKHLVGAGLNCATHAGVAVFPDNGRDADALLKDAELALSLARMGSQRRAVPYSPRLRREWLRTLQVSEQARTALSEDQVFPFYQPQIDLSTGRTTGFEALLRWRHPSKGIQPPGAIIEAFKDPELAMLLSERMRSRILTDIRGWLDRGLPIGRIAINASAIELGERHFSAGVLAGLARFRVPPELIEIEVTETAFMGRQADEVADQLKILTQSGIRVALDDFGTGYGSLIHLKHFPVEVLKIDRSFIADIGRTNQSAVIIRAIIGLAKSLDLEVVAEGVETPIQAQFLADEGCTRVQGYLFARPVPPAEVPALATATWQQWQVSK